MKYIRKSSSLHGKYCYQLNTMSSSLIICDFCECEQYMFTLHLIIGQVFYGTDP